MDTEAQTYPRLSQESWRQELGEELAKPYMIQLLQFVAAERASGVPVYPPKEKVFAALDRLSFDQVKVVIVGQDPYHGPGQAEGLSFSVPRGIKTPPSLRNIYKEIASDLGLPPSGHGHLASWCQQGVLLLNATLTVRQGEPGSHSGRGWEQFTDSVIDCLCRRTDPVAFLLWGNSAQRKVRRLLEAQQNRGERHLLLTAAHPSPLSAYRGFFCCRHFSQVNSWLESQGKSPVDWRVPN